MASPKAKNSRSNADSVNRDVKKITEFVLKSVPDDMSSDVKTFLSNVKYEYDEKEEIKKAERNVIPAHTDTSDSSTSSEHKPPTVKRQRLQKEDDDIDVPVFFATEETAGRLYLQTTSVKGRPIRRHRTTASTSEREAGKVLLSRKDKHPILSPCNCKNLCGMKIEQKQRISIHCQYWSHDYAVQRNWLLNNSVKTSPWNRDYSLMDSSGTRVNVCAQFFLRTLGYTSNSVINWMEKKSPGNKLGTCSRRRLSLALDATIEKTNQYKDESCNNRVENSFISESSSDSNKEYPQSTSIDHSEAIVSQSISHLNQKDKHPILSPCNCKNMCGIKIEEEQRKSIHSQYWSHEYNKQRDWLLNNSVKTSSRNRDYFLMASSGTRIKVCAQFFLRTLGYTSNSVINWMEKKSSGNTLPHAQDTTIEKATEDNIESFDSFCSHYRYQRGHANHRLRLETKHEVNVPVFPGIEETAGRSDRQVSVRVSPAVRLSNFSDFSDGNIFQAILPKDEPCDDSVENPFISESSSDSNKEYQQPTPIGYPEAVVSPSISHVSQKDKHPILSPCNCKNLCGMKIGEEQRKSIHSHYWSRVYSEQRNWLLNNSVKSSSRNRDYFMMDSSGTRKKVCSQFFLRTLGYTSNSVINWMEKRSSGNKLDLSTDTCGIRRPPYALNTTMEKANLSRDESCDESVKNPFISESSSDSNKDYQQPTPISHPEADVSQSISHVLKYIEPKVPSQHSPSPKTVPPETASSEKEEVKVILSQKDKHPILSPCNCKNLCGMKIEEEQRISIHSQYWSRGYDEQRNWLLNNFMKTSSRNRDYFLMDSSGTRIKVCAQFFLRTLGYTSNSVIHWAEKKSSGNTLETSELHCRHLPPDALDTTIDKAINDHIELFNSTCSHHQRAHANHRLRLQMKHEVNVPAFPGIEETAGRSNRQVAVSVSPVIRRPSFSERNDFQANRSEDEPCDNSVENHFISESSIDSNKEYQQPSPIGHPDTETVGCQSICDISQIDKHPILSPCNRTPLHTTTEKTNQSKANESKANQSKDESCADSMKNSFISESSSSRDSNKDDQQPTPIGHPETVISRSISHVPKYIQPMVPSQHSPSLKSTPLETASSEKEEVKVILSQKDKHPILSPCNCKNLCGMKIEEEQRISIHSQYWSQDYDEQRNWLLNNFVKTSSRTRDYFLMNSSGIRIKVCAQFFLRTLGYTSNSVIYWMEKKSSGNTLVAPTDTNDRCLPLPLPPDSLDTTIEKATDDQIKSVDPSCSHYQRAHTNHRLRLQMKHEVDVPVFPEETAGQSDRQGAVRVSPAIRRPSFSEQNSFQANRYKDEPCDDSVENPFILERSIASNKEYQQPTPIGHRGAEPETVGCQSICDINQIDKHPILSPCNCKSLCGMKVEQEQRISIHSQYWSLGYDEQRNWLLNNCVKTSSRNRDYFLIDSFGTRIKVCAQFFLRTLGYTSNSVIYWMEKKSSGNTLVAPTDTNDRCLPLPLPLPPDSLDTTIEKATEDQIKSFDPSCSHYQHAHTNHRLRLQMKHEVDVPVFPGIEETTDQSDAEFAVRVRQFQSFSQGSSFQATLPKDEPCDDGFENPFISESSSDSNKYYHQQPTPIDRLEAFVSQSISHINQKDKHPILSPCNCKNLCGMKIEQEQRKSIHSHYWSREYSEQRSWLLSNSVKTSSRNRDYFLMNSSGTRIKVCSQFFLRTLGYTSNSVINWMERKKPLGNSLVTTDLRGRHRPSNPCT